MSDTVASESKDNLIENKYEMSDILGEGTYGVVYKAHTIDTN